MKKCISYSYFRHPSSVYEGIKGNSALQFEQFLPLLVYAHPYIWPGWDLVIHHDDQAPGLPSFKVLQCLHDRHYLRLVDCGPAPSLCEAMLWRMRPIWEDYDYVACRDIDAIPSVREADAVHEFIDSGLAAHIIHDNPAHEGVMGGTLTVQAPLLKQLLNWPSQLDMEFAMEELEAWNRHGRDQYFLASRVIPRLGDSIMLHTSNDNDSMGILSKNIRRLPTRTTEPGIGVCLEPSDYQGSFYDPPVPGVVVECGHTHD